jgi:hypothetical protein
VIDSNEPGGSVKPPAKLRVGWESVLARSFDEEGEICWIIDGLSSRANTPFDPVVPGELRGLLIALVGCAASPPTPITHTAWAATGPGHRCDADCWRHVMGFLAKTCACTTEECAYPIGKEMIRWVTTEIIEAQHLSSHEAEVDLQVELQPYWDVENACLAKLPRHNPAPLLVVQPLPPPMGIATCDDLLARVTRCAATTAKQKVFVRALWDVEADKLAAGMPRPDIEAECTAESEAWKERWIREYPGC